MPRKETLSETLKRIERATLETFEGLSREETYAHQDEHRAGECVPNCRSCRIEREAGAPWRELFLH